METVTLAQDRMTSAAAEAVPDPAAVIAPIEIKKTDPSAAEEVKYASEEMKDDTVGAEEKIVEQSEEMKDDTVGAEEKIVEQSEEMKDDTVGAEEKIVEQSEEMKDDTVGAEEKIVEQSVEPEVGVQKGVKRQMAGGDRPRKKRKGSVQACATPKNPLMKLNEMKPGLKYEVEAREGPPHAPVFVVSVQVNEQKFTGKGQSKQLAKRAAAQAALASFAQFQNKPESMTMMSQHIDSMDFIADDIKNGSDIFNRFGQSTHRTEQVPGESAPGRESATIRPEVCKKNPVALLNEIHRGLVFTLVKECSTVPSHRFCMAVDVKGERFEGWGENKKSAKANAARAALSKLYYNFPQSVADKIAKSIQDLCQEIMLENQEQAQWKVLAGIAMTTDEEMNDVQVISIATGAKSISIEHIGLNGTTLNDCHAEIISRRCLKDFFYTQLELHLEGEADQSVFMKKEGGGFTLRPDVKFHLFISTSPCGDASKNCPKEAETTDQVDRHPYRKTRGVLRAKIESGEGTIPVKPGQHIQTWDGILHGSRRLLTMSCSDKIASWNVLGLQGALLSYFVEPIYLDSIIVGSLFHPRHMHRAICGRIEESIGDLPSPFRLNKPRMCAITIMEPRHVMDSPDFSINWTTGLGRPEIVNPGTGKTESAQISRLAKQTFFQRFSNLYGHIPTLGKEQDDHPLQLYSMAKSRVTDYQRAKDVICKTFASANLGMWVRKPQEQDEFEQNIPHAAVV